MYCDREIRVSTSGLELKFSPMQLNTLTLIYDAPLHNTVPVIVCPEAASDESLMKKVEADFIAAVNSMKKVFEASQVWFSFLLN